MMGVIVRAVEGKFFGFIKGEDGKEYFFHSSSISDGKRYTTTEWKALQGREVEFEVSEDNSKGLRADVVELL